MIVGTCDRQPVVERVGERMGDKVESKARHNVEPHLSLCRLPEFTSLPYCLSGISQYLTISTVHTAPDLRIYRHCTLILTLAFSHFR